MPVFRGGGVTLSDARDENLEVVHQRFPHLKTIKANVENEWPFEEYYDLILHLGLLYHLDDYKFSLLKSLENADYVVLDTEVADSDDPDFIYKRTEDIRFYDQSVSGIGTRPSPAHIEKILKDYGADFEVVTDSRLNANTHVYDWKIRNTKLCVCGQRRFWFIKTNNKRS